MISFPYKQTLKVFSFFLLALLVHYWLICYLLYRTQFFTLVPVSYEISLRLRPPQLSEGDGENKKRLDGKPASQEEQGKFMEEWGELIENLHNAQKIKAESFEEIDNLLPNQEVSNSYIHRKRDYEDIMVKEVFPTLHDIDKNFSQTIKQSPQKLERYHERNRIIDEFRNEGKILIDKGIKLSVQKKEQAKVPLNFSQEQRDEYFDKTLQLGKEEQLKIFMDKYLGYHPDKGDLPLAIRDLYYKNLQRIAYTFSGDETYFFLDYFQENLNKEDFLMNAQTIAGNLKGSKTSIEILFALDNIYEIQSRALLFLKRFETLEQNYPQEKQNRLHFQSMKYLLKRYLPVLQQKQLATPIDITRKYTQKRLEILDYMQSNTPQNYRLKDILFEKGAVYFQLARLDGRQDLFEQALKIWRQIGTLAGDGDFLNQKAYHELMQILQKRKIESAEVEIDLLLRRRYNDDIEKKIQREKNLLYP